MDDDDIFTLFEEVERPPRRRPVFVSSSPQRVQHPMPPPPPTPPRMPLQASSLNNDQLLPRPPLCHSKSHLHGVATGLSSSFTSPVKAMHDDEVGGGLVSAELFPSLPMEDDLRHKLLPHQCEGVDWLFAQHKSSGLGCLLADEMGLGKTVQVASYLGVLFRNRMIRNVLIVVPSTLLDVWASALVEWGRLGDAAAHSSASSSSAHIEVVHNEKKPARDARWQRMTQRRYAAAITSTIVITTYGLMKRDIASISKVKFDYIVLDEAHQIKDASTETAKAALELRAYHKIALTGTPLMNHVHDLWSLFEFLDPNLLSSDASSFAATGHAILRSNERDSAASEREFGKQQLAALQDRIRPRMLRREKSTLAHGELSSSISATTPAGHQGCRAESELVPRSLWKHLCRKLDVVVWVTMTDVQRAQYVEFLHSDVVQLALRQLRVKQQPLVLLNALRNIVNHPWLNFSEENFRDSMATPLLLPKELPEFGDILSSAKLTVAVELVMSEVSTPTTTSEEAKTSSSHDQQRKMLVFSRSKRLLTIFGFLLQHRGVQHMRLDGDVAAAQRGKLVKQFAASLTCHVCLLTSQVGGVGLTLNCASRVLMLDPSWNPAVDAQAADRVHRIGQTSSEVIVYRLIAAGTVDEKIYRNQIYKMTAAMQLHQTRKQNHTLPSTPNATGQRDSLTTVNDEESQPTAVAAQKHENALCELHRYFTRQQLRCMFELGDCTTSETAQHLLLVHQSCTSTSAVEIDVLLSSIEKSVRALAPGRICAVTNHGDMFEERQQRSGEENEPSNNVCGRSRTGQTQYRKRRKPHSAPPTATLTELADQLSDFDATVFETTSSTSSLITTQLSNDSCSGNNRCSILLQGASLEELLHRELLATHMMYHDVPIRRLNLDDIFAEGRVSVQLTTEIDDNEDWNEDEEGTQFPSSGEDEDDDDEMMSREHRRRRANNVDFDWATFEDDTTSSKRPSLAMRAHAARSALLQWGKRDACNDDEGSERESLTF